MAKRYPLNPLRLLGGPLVTSSQDPVPRGYRTISSRTLHGIIGAVLLLFVGMAAGAVVATVFEREELSERRAERQLWIREFAVDPCEVFLEHRVWQAVLDWECYSDPPSRQGTNPT